MSAGPQPDRAFIERSLRWAIIGALVFAVVFALLWVLRGALTPLAVAFALAYLLDPLIDRFEERRIPRRAAIFLLLLLSLLGLLAFALVGIPAMQREIVALSQSLPTYVNRALEQLGPSVERYLGVDVPRSIEQALAQVEAGQVAVPLEAGRELLSRAVPFFAGTVGALLGLIVIPVFTYYLLAEFDAVKRWLLDLVPPRYQGFVVQRARIVDRLVAGFIRGQLIVVLVLVTLYAVGFSLIGVDGAVLISAFAGILFLVPYLGNAVAVTAASVMCLLQFGLDVRLALVLGWYAIVQTLEGYVLTPRIVGRSVGLHPMTVIVALLIGGNLLGFLGLIVAVPLAAVVKVFAGELYDLYRRSSLYRGRRPAADAAEAGEGARNVDGS